MSFHVRCLFLASIAAFAASHACEGQCSESDVEQAEDEEAEIMSLQLLQLRRPEAPDANVSLGLLAKANSSLDLNAATGNQVLGYRARRALVLSNKLNISAQLEAKDINFAWDQISKAVEIDELQEQLANASGTLANLSASLTAALASHLLELTQQCPDFEAIKSGLNDTWSQVTSLVKADNIQAVMDQIKDKSSEEFQQLKEQFDSLTQNIDMEQVRSSVTCQWNALVAHLPNIDDVRAAWDAATSQVLNNTQVQEAAQTVQAAAQSAWAAISGFFR